MKAFAELVVVTLGAAVFVLGVTTLAYTLLG